MHNFDRYTSRKDRMYVILFSGHCRSQTFLKLHQAHVVLVEIDVSSTLVTLSKRETIVRLTILFFWSCGRNRKISILKKRMLPNPVRCGAVEIGLQSGP